MFKNLIRLYALNEIECTPNRGWSFPHWLASMLLPSFNTLTMRQGGVKEDPFVLLDSRYADDNNSDRTQ